MLLKHALINQNMKDKDRHLLLVLTFAFYCLSDRVVILSIYNKLVMIICKPQHESSICIFYYFVSSRD